MKLVLPIVFILLTASLAFSQSAAEWKKRGTAPEDDGKSKEALEAFQKAEAKTPGDTDLLVKIAKQYDDMMLAGCVQLRLPGNFCKRELMCRLAIYS